MAYASIEPAIKIIQEAGEILRHYFGKGPIGITEKEREWSDRTGRSANLVSRADQESEEHIVRSLEEAYPGYGIISEERPPLRPDALYRWLIDPLDGTANFVSNIPIFAISMALQAAQTTVAGLIHLLPSGNVYAVERGKGSIRNGEPIRIRQAPLAHSLIAAEFSGWEPEMERCFHRASPWCAGIRVLGSTAAALAMVSSGELSAVVSNSSALSVAAGFLMVDEAGGEVSTTTGASRPLFSRRPTIFSCGGDTHRELLGWLGS